MDKDKQEIVQTTKAFQPWKTNQIQGQTKTERACVSQASKDAILDIHTFEVIIRLVLLIVH